MAENRESGFGLPVRIDYLPPRWLAGVNVLIHVGAILCVLPTSLDLSIKALLIGLIFTGFVITSYRLYRQIGGLTPCKLILDAEDHWYIARAHTRRREVTLISGGFLNPVFAVLGFLDNRGERYVFILSSSNVDKQTLRRLRVRLRFRKTAE